MGQLILSAAGVPAAWLGDLARFRTLTGGVELAVAALLRSRHVREQHAAAEVVRALGLLGCANLVAEAARTDDATLAESAERCLLHLAERAAAMGTRQRLEEGARLLSAAVWRAADRLGPGRGRRARLALCLLEEAGIRPAGDPVLVRAWLTDESSAGLLGLRRLLKSVPLPCTAAAAWVWLARPTLASAAAARLIAGNGESPAREAAWRSTRFHLAFNPARAAAMARLVSDDGGLPRSLVLGAAEAASIPPGVRAGYARLLGLLPGSSRLRDAALGALIGDAEPAVRHAAVRSARTLPTHAGVLADLCFDADRRVARSAALAVWCRGAAGGTMQPLTRSADGVVRGLAEDAVAGDDPLNAEHPLGRLALRRMLAAADGCGHALLRHALTLSEGERCVRAARAVRLLDLAEPYRDALLAVLEEARASDDAWAERAGSAVLGALADAPGGEVDVAIGEALCSGSARVRAAAIDASVRRARRVRDAGAARALAERLAALRDDAAHRPRGSAARGLLVLGSVSLGTFGAEHLGERIVVSMVRDERPMHQAAGLWAAERLADRLAGHAPVMDAVGQLTRQVESKLDPIVAARCQRAAERLVIEVRGAWVRAKEPVAEATPQAVGGWRHERA